MCAHKIYQGDALHDAGGMVAEGFQIFEWMVAGCGNDATIPQTPETLCLLFQGCHQAGALEKALEVLSWMRLSHIKPSPEIYAHLQDTIDIVQLWDRNVLESSAGVTDSQRNVKGLQTALHVSKTHSAIMPTHLRPSPFDGRRSSYASRQPEQTQVDLLPCQVYYEQRCNLGTCDERRRNCIAIFLICRMLFWLLRKSRHIHGCLPPCSL